MGEHGAEDVASALDAAYDSGPQSEQLLERAAAARQEAERVAAAADARARAAAPSCASAAALLSEAERAVAELQRLGNQWVAEREQRERAAAERAVRRALAASEQKRAAGDLPAAAAALCGAAAQAAARSGTDATDELAAAHNAALSEVASAVDAALHRLIAPLPLLIPSDAPYSPSPPLLKEAVPLWAAAEALHGVRDAFPDPCQAHLVAPFRRAFAAHFGPDLHLGSPEWPLAYCRHALGNHAALLRGLAAAGTGSAASSPELRFFEAVAGAAAEKAAECVGSAEASEDDGAFLHCIAATLQFEETLAETFPMLSATAGAASRVLASPGVTERWVALARSCLNDRVAPLVIGRGGGLLLQLEAPELLEIDPRRPSAGAHALGSFLSGLAERLAAAAAGGAGATAAALVSGVFAPALSAYAQRAARLAAQSESGKPQGLPLSAAGCADWEFSEGCGGRLDGHPLAMLSIAANSCHHLCSCIDAWLLTPALAAAAGAALAQCGDELHAAQQRLTAEAARHCAAPLERGCDSAAAAYDCGAGHFAAATADVLGSVGVVLRVLCAPLAPQLTARIARLLDRGGVAAALRAADSASGRRYDSAAVAEVAAALLGCAADAAAAAGAEAPACAAAVRLLRRGPSAAAALCAAQRRGPVELAAAARVVCGAGLPADQALALACAVHGATQSPAHQPGKPGEAAGGGAEQGQQQQPAASDPEVPPYVPVRGLLRWASSAVGTVSVAAGARVVGAAGAVADAVGQARRARRAWSHDDVPLAEVDLSSPAAEGVRSRLQMWLATIPIGGNEASTSRRHYDVEPLVTFALRRHLGSAAPEEIYREYVDWQAAQELDSAPAPAAPRRGQGGESPPPEQPSEQPPVPAAPAASGSGDGWEFEIASDSDTAAPAAQPDSAAAAGSGGAEVDDGWDIELDDSPSASPAPAAQGGAAAAADPADGWEDWGEEDEGGDREGSGEARSPAPVPVRQPPQAESTLAPSPAFQQTEPHRPAAAPPQPPPAPAAAGTEGDDGDGWEEWGGSDSGDDLR